MFNEMPCAQVCALLEQHSYLSGFAIQAYGDVRDTTGHRMAQKMGIWANESHFRISTAQPKSGGCEDHLTAWLAVS